MQYQPQIITDSYRTRGPLVQYGTELLYDVFADGKHAEANRVPFSPPAEHRHPPAFPNILRTEFYRTLAERVADPSKIHQRGSSLCGPASLLYVTALRFPSRYAGFLTRLYEYGDASLGGLRIKPGHDCRHYDPGVKIAAADWVGLAGIRDSENVLFDYDEVEDMFAGITLPMTLTRWFGQAGFANVQNEANVFFTKGEDNLREADALFRQGKNVCLLVHADGIETINTGMTFIPNHWVVLTSGINFNGPNLSFSLFTWGDGNYQVPQTAGIYPISGFLKSYYGYVCCD